MADVVMLAIVVAFFVVCVGYVSLCQRIIGADPLEGLEGDVATEVEVRR